MQKSIDGDFSRLRNSDRLAGTFHWSVRRSQYSLAGTFHCRRSPLVENRRFRQARKGAENTKEKSRQCFTVREASIYLSLDLPFQDFWSLEACYSWKDLKLGPSPIRKEPSNSFGTVFFLSLLMHNLARKGIFT